MKLKRLIYLIVGCICLGLGTIGVALPILPTVPFYLATVFCFAKSSQRLHDWFVGTTLYKKNLQSFVEKRGMTVKTKIGIIIPVTLLMGVGFFMMMRKNIIVPSVILAIVWVCHIIYFVFGVKTVSAEEAARETDLSERYPHRKTIRVSGVETDEDAGKLEKALAVVGEMEALVSRGARTVTVHTRMEPDDTLLKELIRNAGFQPD